MAAPARPLCQSERGSCAACCGVYNFRARDPAATQARLQERTRRVRAVFPDERALAALRDELLAEERPHILFATVKVCPFAGYVEEGRVGCLIHPARHPEGTDLRDLAVYPREVCRDHFCAPHDWLRPREVALAQCAEGSDYGLVVTDAGLVKAVLALLEEHLHRPFALDDATRGQESLAALWRRLMAWPFRDPDPHRFGGFQVLGDDAIERSLPGCLEGMNVDARAAERTVLDGLGTRVESEADALAALAALRAALEEAAQGIERARARALPIIPQPRSADEGGTGEAG